MRLVLVSVTLVLASTLAGAAANDAALLKEVQGNLPTCGLAKR